MKKADEFTGVILMELREPGTNTVTGYALLKFDDNLRELLKYAEYVFTGAPDILSGLKFDRIMAKPLAVQIIRDSSVPNTMYDLTEQMLNDGEAVDVDMEGEKFDDYDHLDDFGSYCLVVDRTQAVLEGWYSNDEVFESAAFNLA